MPDRGPGQPTKLNPELQKRICDLIEAGMSKEAAAAHAGIASSTLFLWQAKGLDGDPVYQEFSEAIKAAEDKQKGNDELVISNAASVGIWTAAAWRLERKYPQQYGRTQRITADVNATAAVVHGQMPAEDAAKVLADIISARRRGNGDGGSNPPPNSAV
ncbi:MAG: hypothetical protein V1755_05490 [Chloroflexota bacterium]